MNKLYADGLSGRILIYSDADLRSPLLKENLPKQSEATDSSGMQALVGFYPITQQMVSMRGGDFADTSLDLVAVGLESLLAYPTGDVTAPLFFTPWDQVKESLGGSDSRRLHDWLKSKIRNSGPYERELSDLRHSKAMEIIYHQALAGELAAYHSESLARIYDPSELPELGQRESFFQVPDPDDPSQLMDTSVVYRMDWEDFTIFRKAIDEESQELLAVAPCYHFSVSGFETDLPFFWLDAQELSSKLDPALFQHILQYNVLALREDSASVSDSL